MTFVALNLGFSGLSKSRTLAGCVRPTFGPGSVLIVRTPPSASSTLVRSTTTGSTRRTCFRERPPQQSFTSSFHALDSIVHREVGATTPSLHSGFDHQLIHAQGNRRQRDSSPARWTRRLREDQARQPRGRPRPL